jgi:hypothetical protein
MSVQIWITTYQDIGGNKAINFMGSSVENLPVVFITNSLNQTYGYLGLGYPTDSKPRLFSQLFKDNDYYLVFDTIQYKISFGNIPGSLATISTQ